MKGREGKPVPGGITTFAMIFFHQRQIWVPTIWGWISVLILVLGMGLFAVHHVYAFLAPNEPVDAHVLVVEGWLAPRELEQAVRTFRRGSYTRIVTTGGPVQDWPATQYGDYATMAANYLAKLGVPRDLIAAVPTPPSAQERTFLSAVMLRRSAQRLGIKLDSIDIFSSGVHARRSRLLFQMALGPTAHVGVLAARPEGYSPDAWWRASKGVEAIVFQSIGLAWVKCCFWPGSPGSQQEGWGS